MRGTVAGLIVRQYAQLEYGKLHSPHQDSARVTAGHWGAAHRAYLLGSAHGNRVTQIPTGGPRNESRVETADCHSAHPDGRWGRVTEKLPGEPARGGLQVARGAQPLVLVVDDEAAVRKLLSLGFATAGFIVKTAADGIDALHIVEEEFQHLALVLTDVLMPRMDGCQLAAVVRSRWPHLPVIFMTGQPGEHAERLDAARLIQKPFRIDGVVRRVKQELSGGSATDDPDGEGTSGAGCGPDQELP